MEFSGFLFVSTSLCHILFSKAWEPEIRFRVYSHESMPYTMVVDCSHNSCDQITHHLKSKRNRELMDLSIRGDSTTDAVLNGIKKKTLTQSSKRYAFVSSNHFDVDSFLSVWCFINKDLAIKNELLLRECARIGDFRELQLTSPTQDLALRVVCWLNSEEKRLFYKPFESTISVANGEEDGVLKFDYFLPLFADLIKNILDPYIYELYRDEYERVICEYRILANCQDNILKFPKIKLVCVKTMDPMHYYSLFSASLDCDIILMMYDKNRYELEIKYTSFVDINSRECLPRVEMQVLAKFLNEMEVDRRMKENDAEYDLQLNWLANRITDSGPILRLENQCKKLSKVERYGNPFERPIYSSFIPSEDFKNVVISYFDFAYSDSCLFPKRDWNWTEIHEINRKIQWELWLKRMRCLHLNL